jgi:RsiW-degrading membrane proteinase PrsW (M82 family)
MLIEVKQTSRHRIHQLSRDKHHLARLSVFIVCASVAFAYIISRASAPKIYLESDATAMAEASAKAQDEKAVAPAEFARRLRASLYPAFTSSVSGNADALDQVIDEAIVDPTTNALFKAFVRVSVHDDEDSESLTYLRTMAVLRPAVRFANEFLGDLAWWQGDLEGAVAHYDAEATLPDGSYARSKVVSLLLKSKDRDRLVELTQDSRYKLGDHQSILRFGVHLKDPILIIRGVFLHDYGRVPGLVWPLTLLVAALWFIMIVKLCQVGRWHSAPVYAGLVGVLLGVVSTTFTLFAVVWQEDVLGFKFDGTEPNDFIVWVCGVGVREESVKLALFAVMTPWLYRLRDPKAVMVGASCVGLGFAVQENLGYFGESGSAVFARFLTANFFHISLTGTLGFAFCRLLYTPLSEWERFLGTFILVVVVHGVYDFLVSNDGGFFAIMLFSFFVHHYFRVIQKHCPLSRRQMVSPLGVFVIGSALVVGLSMMTAAAVSPSFSSAIGMVTGQLLGYVPLMFLFINQFRND